jgi:hypothetical protein
MATEGPAVVKLSKANASWNQLALEISRDRLRISTSDSEAPKPDRGAAGSSQPSTNEKTTNR